MGRIKPFRLKSGTRVGPYKITAVLGRGWEAEVYAVREVPTDARRAMRLVRRDRKIPMRDLIHSCWYFETLAETGSVARYYHMGQWFLKDDEGVFYYVFEELAGENLLKWLRKRRGRINPPLALKIASEVARSLGRIHEEWLAVGDFQDAENLIVLNKNSHIKVCDCYTGVADHPNRNYRKDIKEFKSLVKRIFRGHRRSKLYQELIDIIEQKTQRHSPREVLTAIHKSAQKLQGDLKRPGE